MLWKMNIKVAQQRKVCLSFLFLCWERVWIRSCFYGSQGSQRKRLQHENQDKESGWDRNRAAMEDGKKNREGNSPCLRAKAPGDKRSHVVPVKRQKRGSQCCNTRRPVVEHRYRVEMKGFSSRPCQTLPSS